MDTEFFTGDIVPDYYLGYGNPVIDILDQTGQNLHEIRLRQTIVKNIYSETTDGNSFDNAIKYLSSLDGPVYIVVRKKTFFNKSYDREALLKKITGNPDIRQVFSSSANRIPVYLLKV
ncbi:MAG: hypothetical protein ABIH89_05485 [Elusimicrobiota bacterium]